MKNNNVMADVKYFWKELAVRERLICLAILVVASIVTGGVLSTAFGAALVFGCTYVLAMFGILQLVNWRSASSQKTASLIMIFWVVGNLLSNLGIFGFIFQLIWIVALVLLIMKFVLGFDLNELWETIRDFFKNL